MGSYYHMWWMSKVAKKYWEIIYVEINPTLRYVIPKEPEFFLLSLKLETLKEEDRPIK